LHIVKIRHSAASYVVAGRRRRPITRNRPTARGVLVKIGVYAFARIFNATLPLSVDWQLTVMIIAA